MNIYKSETIPYTYLIGWSTQNKWYYGVQYGQNVNPKNLWKTYFTSSKIIQKFRKEYGEPDIIQIRKIFSSAIFAKKWEDTVLRRLNAAKMNHF